MALATKCPHCNTTFRVAHDQLKLRGGIVRCGACNEVFDGNAALVDPAPRQPVIIDLPAPARDAAPHSGAIIDTHAAMPGMDAGLPAPSAELSEHAGHENHTATPAYGTPAAWRFGARGAEAVAPVQAAPAASLHETNEPGAGGNVPARDLPATSLHGTNGYGSDTAASGLAMPETPLSGTAGPGAEVMAPAPSQHGTLGDAAARAPGAPAGSRPGASEDDPSAAVPAWTAPPPAPAATAPAMWRFGAAGHHADAAGGQPAQPAAPDADAMPPQDTAGALATEPEPDFDLDLNGDEPPAPPPLAQDEAFDLDFDIDTPPHINPALAADTPALRDDYASAALSSPGHETLPDETIAHEPVAGGRLEPTLDIPDEHLNAVALHDSFELDAYPHGHDDGLHSIDERGHSLDDAAWQAHGERGERQHFGDSTAGDSLHSMAPAAPEQTASAPTVPVNTGGDDGDDDADDIVTLSSAAAALAPEPTAPATPVSAREPEEPGFVKRSRRQERWGKASRIAMACALPLLLAGLAWQAVATFRNPLAAAVPSLKPALVSACALAGCKVELPSQLDALAIEQGELQTMADNIFSFSTSLRNQSPTAQSWPYIELILNDSADKPVLRRVFAPRDYLPPGADLASGFLPRSEQPVKLYFELSRVKASGYHIAVFYP
jgi:predicted Zn finger-like uncharacterized protein